MNKKIASIILPVLYVALIVVLAVATFVEHWSGTSAANRYIYSSVPFALLWGALALLMVYVVSVRLRRNRPALFLHVSFLVILAGALVTRVFGERGVVSFAEGQRIEAFFTPDGVCHRLPFGLTLSRFEVVCYPGTDAPLDYRSQLLTDGGDTLMVSMNNVLSLRGYRFYQSGFGPDHRSTTLSVNHDPWGMGLSYAGYLMLAVSFVWLLFSRSGRFRQLVRSVGATACAVLMTSCAAEPSDMPPTIPAESVGCLGNVRLLYNGRIVPFNTYATDFTLKLTGRANYRGLVPEQVLVGWMLFPEQWQHQPMLKLKGQLPPDLDVPVVDGRVSVASLFDAERNYKLLPYLQRGDAGKCIADLNDKVQLVAMLTTGEALQMYPLSIDGRSVWHSLSAGAPYGAPVAEWEAFSHFTQNLKSAVLRSDARSIRDICAQIIAIQHRNALHMPPQWKAKLEISYNRLRPTTWLWRIGLTVGLVALTLMSVWYGMRRGRAVGQATLWLLAVLCTLQLASVAARGVISGNVPVSNGYETMLFLALCIMALALLARRMAWFMPPLGLLLSGFALLVADLGMNNPHITPLMPVLHSPWLSVHVSVIMMSYALLALLMVNGVVALLSRSEGQRKRLASVGEVLLYPALALLAVGIFTGAVWANESWGRYWAWDPKEVWALITLMVYAVPVHGSLCPWTRSPRAFHIYAVAAFLSVLMTYFGVNYLLGGMHSYGAQ